VSPGQVGAQAAHTLQVLVDVQQARDQPQVSGDRRLPRQDAQQPPFGLGRRLPDLPVTADDPLGGVGVAVGQRDQGVVELRLYRPAQGDQPAVEVDQLFGEGCPHDGPFSADRWRWLPGQGRYKLRPAERHLVTADPDGGRLGHLRWANRGGSAGIPPAVPPSGDVGTAPALYRAGR
jgi:hypothetical protein